MLLNLAVLQSAASSKNESYKGEKAITSDSDLRCSVVINKYL